MIGPFRHQLTVIGPFCHQLTVIGPFRHQTTVIGSSFALPESGSLVVCMDISNPVDVSVCHKSLSPLSSPRIIKFFHFTSVLFLISLQGYKRCFLSNVHRLNCATEVIQKHHTDTHL